MPNLPLFIKQVESYTFLHTAIIIVLSGNSSQNRHVLKIA